jgi:E3 ubiquitin-protein ligase DOA10
MVDEVLLPRLSEQLTTARERFAQNAAATDRLTRVSEELDDYVALRRSAAGTPAPADQAVMIARVTTTFNRMTTQVRAVRDDEFAAAERSGNEARDTYSSTQRQLLIGTSVSLLVALAVVLLLVRDLVPRLRAYAGFAADVAVGKRVGG